MIIIPIKWLYLGIYPVFRQTQIAVCKNTAVLQSLFGGNMMIDHDKPWDLGWSGGGPYFQTKANEKGPCIKLLAEMLWCRLDCLQVKHLQRPESIHMPYSVGGQNNCFSVREFAVLFLLSMAGFCCRLLHAIREVSPSCACRNIFHLSVLRNQWLNQCWRNVAGDGEVCRKLLLKSSKAFWNRHPFAFQSHLSSLDFHDDVKLWTPVPLPHWCGFVSK